MLTDAEIEDLDDPTDDINIQDSSDEMGSSSTDQCPVCLMSLKGQLLGTPNNCPHVFCFECIQEWAKVRKTSMLFSVDINTGSSCKPEFWGENNVKRLSLEDDNKALCFTTVPVLII